MKHFFPRCWSFLIIKFVYTSCFLHTTWGAFLLVCLYKSNKREQQCLMPQLFLAKDVTSDPNLYETRLIYKLRHGKVWGFACQSRTDVPKVLRQLLNWIMPERNSWYIDLFSGVGLLVFAQKGLHYHIEKGPLH